MRIFGTSITSPLLRFEKFEEGDGFDDGTLGEAGGVRCWSGGVYTHGVREGPFMYEAPSTFTFDHSVGNEG